MPHPWFHSFYKGVEIRQRTDGKFGFHYRRICEKFPDWHYIYGTLADVKHDVDVELEDLLRKRGE